MYSLIPFLIYLAFHTFHLGFNYSRGDFLDSLLIWQNSWFGFAVVVIFGGLMIFDFFREIYNGKKSWGIGIIFSFFCLLIFMLPFVIKRGLPKNLYTTTKSILTKQTKAADYNDEQLDGYISNGFLKKNNFKNSTALYIAGYEIQKQRILRKCGGKGDKKWLYKRVCFSLMIASNLQLFQKYKPRLVAKEVENYIKWQTIDFIHRGSFENKNISSRELLVFLQPFEYFGEYELAQKITKLLEGDNSIALAELEKFKLQYEKELMAGLNSSNIYKIYKFKFVGPLELGI